MQLKKNPNVDAKRNSMLYFQIGLASISVLTYLGMELKFPDPIIEVKKLEVVENIIEDEEIIPMTQQVQKLPPPPPPAPEVIKVVDNKVIIEDKPIQTTETQENQRVETPVSSSDVGGSTGDVEDVEDDVPFTVLEDIPLFPGCEKVAKAQQRACFDEQMTKHIKKYFTYPSAALEKEIEGRVTVMFVIGKDGKVGNLRMKSKDGTEILQKEAERIIMKLPQFTPGKQRGRAVGVSYAQPINFKIEKQ